jgi:ribosomal protein L20
MLGVRMRKLQKCINFDWVILSRIEECCNKEGISVSKFVNEVLKRVVMSDSSFYKEMAKHHNAQFYHYKILSEGVLDDSKTLC